MVKTVDKTALEWWTGMPIEQRILVHKNSRWGHLPYEVFNKYTVLISNTYKAIHGAQKHDRH